MLHVILVIHLIIAVTLVGVILLQRSEGGALGIGGGGLMTGRAAGNLLTRTTGILATGFFATSLALALIANQRSQPSSIMDQPPASSAPAQPAAPAVPSAPISR
jgi:preprotein translocase subunit SecG